MGRGWVHANRLALSTQCLSPAGFGSRTRGGKADRDPVVVLSRRVPLPSLLAESPASCHPGH